MSDYRPIPCELYDRYEIAILHGERLRVAWHDDGDAVHVEILHPMDLQTSDGVEYLLAKSLSGAQLRLRLDYIVNVQTAS